MDDYEIKNLLFRCYGKNEKSDICYDLDKFVQCAKKNKNINNEIKCNKLSLLPHSPLSQHSQLSQHSPQYNENIKNMKDIMNKHKVIGNNVCYLTTQIDLSSIKNN